MLNRSRLRTAKEPRPPEPAIDTNTTAGVIEAINSQKYGCQNTIFSKAVISSPVPVKKGDKFLLSFFMYLKPGSFNNIKILPPICRIEVELGQAEDTIKFISIEPQELNINVSPMTELGSVFKSFPLSINEEDEDKKYQEFHQKKDRFNESMDDLMGIYPKPTENLTEEEKNTVKFYKDYLYSKEEIEFLLPAYKALNPHFFEWIDSAIKSLIQK
jgi:hypothetical protein